MTPSPETILLQNCRTVYTNAAGSAPQHNVDILIADGAIATIGPNLNAPPRCTRIEASRWVVIPGLVNTHHHLSQQLTRTCATHTGLIGWLAELYPVWRHLTPETAYTAAQVGLAELVLSGATTISDFTYFYPHGSAEILDAQISAARSIGCRYAPVRGGIVELEHGVIDKLPADFAASLESPDTMLTAMNDAVDNYHDPTPESFTKVAVGLTEKAYSRPDLMQTVAGIAHSHGIGLHTHLHPRPDERDRAAHATGMSPIDYLESVGWWDSNLWVAHGTGLSEDDTTRMARAGVGLSLSPSSNARFGLPIAPGMAAHRSGVTVSVGVDGAASNDSGNLLAESRLVLQTQRIREGSAGAAFGDVTPELVLHWATRAGAQTLGWHTLGELTPGAPADVAAYSVDHIENLGATDDIAALLLCGSGSVRAEFVCAGGKTLVKDRQLTTLPVEDLLVSGRQATESLWAHTERTVP